jgi:hypothetical protein
MVVLEEERGRKAREEKRVTVVTYPIYRVAASSPWCV